jgi:hypothetical protein
MVYGGDEHRPVSVTPVVHREVIQPELYGLFMSGVFLSLSLVQPDPKRDFFTALALSEAARILII